MNIRDAVNKTFTQKPVCTFEYLGRLCLCRNMYKEPLPPISDHRIVAGLLFSRWNDFTIRFLDFRRSAKIATVNIVSKFSTQFEVTADSVCTLADFDCLEHGLGEFTRTSLSLIGRRMVVNEWFTDVSVLDRLKVR